MRAFPESTCAECGKKMEAGVMRKCEYGGHCSWYVPRAASSVAFDLLKALKRVSILIPLAGITVRDVISAGDDVINAVGLNPWCMNEGRANGDETISLDFIHDAIAKAEEAE